VIAFLTKNIIIFIQGGDFMTTKSETKVITVRLSEETKFAIEMAAHAENRSVNNWILNVIKNHLKEQNAKK
jgi:uncharacterized protein (DUF1778 family)